MRLSQVVDNTDRWTLFTAVDRVTEMWARDRQWTDARRTERGTSATNAYMALNAVLLLFWIPCRNNNAVTIFTLSLSAPTAPLFSRTGVSQSSLWLKHSLGQVCAKFGSDRPSRLVTYKEHTHTHTHVTNFYRATRMHSADYAAARWHCLSVCPSVTRRYSVETANISQNSFTIR